MGLRILTGILEPQAGFQAAGKANIQFNPHGVTGDATGKDLKEWGEAGTFDVPPSAVVSLKRIVATTPLESFEVTEGPPTTALVEVEWAASPGEAIQAISYMIIGEA